ncbi:hypothetical protein JCM19235_215 [Vibrio maritimus]|uniref:NADP-dependent oxidoreductase domain-containing protein n=1 Tax=Vibrio maritimus TaxID=990268 RepID=A0A090RZQ6_9VIBR|nr:hypothetical protein JCM19235_215 [Vibrio maritimus]
MALKKAGKIRAIGISNANQAELEQYQQTGVVDAVQEKYNLIERQLEQTLLPSTIKLMSRVLATLHLPWGC